MGKSWDLFKIDFLFFFSFFWKSSFSFKAKEKRVSEILPVPPYTLLLFSCSVVSDSRDPMAYSTPGFPVLRYLPELAQTHVHYIDDAT